MDSQKFQNDAASVFGKLKTSDFFYDLPKELIAQHPAEPRDSARLLLVDGGRLREKRFSELLSVLKKGDVLVLNDSKVIPARLLGRKKSDGDFKGASCEVLLLRRIDLNHWECIVKPGKRLRIGSRIEFIPGELSCVISEEKSDGIRVAEFSYNGNWETILDRAGTMPTPPYIHEKLKNPDDYQTVYALHEGSAAAPTAGLHFTEQLLKNIESAGIEVVKVCLHVGLGTFRDVKSRKICEHEMHEEYFEVSSEAAEKINRAKSENRRIVAVGTTSCRVLESASDDGGTVRAGISSTKLFIYPSYKFKLMDALITNFHLPESTLMMLVTAFGGYSRIMEAYKFAVDRKFRFFSFGDAMYIEKNEAFDLPPSAYL